MIRDGRRSFPENFRLGAPGTPSGSRDPSGVTDGIFPGTVKIRKVNEIRQRAPRD